MYGSIRLIFVFYHKIFISLIEIVLFYTGVKLCEVYKVKHS